MILKHGNNKYCVKNTEQRILRKEYRISRETQNLPSFYYEFDM